MKSKKSLNSNLQSTATHSEQSRTSVTGFKERGNAGIDVAEQGKRNKR